MSAKKTKDLPQISDKKLFRIFAYGGFALWAIGMILNFILGGLYPGDFNFLPTIIASIGVVLVVGAVIYALVKILARAIAGRMQAKKK